MEIPEWIFSSNDVELQWANLDTFLKEEFIEITFDLDINTLLKPDCHSWWISKMQSGCEDILEERYAIKFCFKLGKNATETYGMLHIAFGASCMNRASVFEWHKRFKEGKESMIGGVRRSIHQNWLSKRLGLGLLC